MWVQLLGKTTTTATNATSPTPGAGDDASEALRTEYGKLTLKTCLSAICISRYVQYSAVSFRRSPSPLIDEQT